MRYLGIDYGTKRIGLAVSNEEGTMAFPEGVLPNEKWCLDEIYSICNIHKIDNVVIGESKDFKGKDNQIMEDVRIFVEKLKMHGLTVVYEPEVLTSMQAERIQGQTDKTDASAATIILQSYLDRQKFKNSPPPEEMPDKYTIRDEDIEK